MRHGAVAYFDDAGRPVAPDAVPLTDEGRAQALAARELLEDIRIDRVICSGLPRTTETATLVAPEREVEVWPELKELMGSKLSSIPAAELEEAFVHAFRGVVPNEKRFLGGETIGALFDRVVPALDRLVADEDWDTVLVVAHGAVNRAILLVRPHRRADVPRPLRAGAGLPERPRRRRRLDRPRGQRRARRPRPPRDAEDDDGAVLGRVPAAGSVRAARAALTPIRSAGRDYVAAPWHFSFETSANVPPENFATRSQPTGC